MLKPIYIICLFGSSAHGDKPLHPNPYLRDYAVAEWPGPAPLIARAADADAGASVNKNCPYSGRPVTDFLEMSGRIYGFCNPRCRDKTVFDPAAWPAFMALVAA